MTFQKVHTIEELEALYGEVNQNSIAKVTAQLTPAYQAVLEASPFCAVATQGPEGLDCSPRGDAAGFVKVLSPATLALPDRRGNNRLDTLRNIVRCPLISLLFLLPGMNETLRINGKAFVTSDENLREQLQVNEVKPNTIVVVNIDEVYFQCARALIRSKLWDPNSYVDRQSLPSAGIMAKSAIQDFDASTYDEELAERQRKTLY